MLKWSWMCWKRTQSWGGMKNNPVLHCGSKTVKENLCLSRAFHVDKHLHCSSQAVVCVHSCSSHSPACRCMLCSFGQGFMTDWIVLEITMQCKEMGWKWWREKGDLPLHCTARGGKPRAKPQRGPSKSASAPTRLHSPHSDINACLICFSKNSWCKWLLDYLM